MVLFLSSEMRRNTKNWTSFLVKIIMSSFYLMKMRICLVQSSIFENLRIIWYSTKFSDSYRCGLTVTVVGKGWIS